MMRIWYEEEVRYAHELHARLIRIISDGQGWSQFQSRPHLLQGGCNPIQAFAVLLFQEKEKIQ